MNLLDQLPCAVVVTDAMGHLLDANAELLTLVGGSRESRVGSSIEDLLPPASRIFLQTHVWPTLLRDGSIQEVHMQVIASDHARVPVLLNSRLGEHLHEPAYFWTVFVARDRHRFEAELVEQRNLAETTSRALEESQRFIKGITDATPGMLAYWDKDLRCRFANNAYVEWFGRQPEEIMGITLQELLGERVFKLNEGYARAALAGREQQFERELTKDDGSLSHTWAQYVPDTSGGEVRGFFVKVTDVTALKSSQLALEEAQRLGQTGSWTWQVDGDRVGWSAQMFSILGADPQGAPPSFAEQARIYDPESYAALAERVAVALQTGAPYTLELRYRHADGHSGWVEARGEALRDDSGRVSGLRGTVQEITQRREQQRALELAQDRLRTMYETTPAMLHSIDSQGRMLHVSDAWLTCLGYRRDEVMGRLSSDFLTEESRRRAREEVLPDFFKDGRCDKVPYQMVTSRGEIIDVLLSAILERDERGLPTRSLAVTEDVTLRRRAERELARQHERLRNLIDGTNAGTWEWNVQTGEVIVNPRWAEIIGWTVEELGAVTHQFRADITHPDELEQTDRLLREHFAGHSHDYVTEVRLRHRDGHWIWAEDRGRLITRTPDGRPEWVFGIHIDITDRRRQEDELRRSNADLEQFAYIASHDLQEPLRMVVSYSELLAERYQGQLDEKADKYILYAVGGARRMQHLVADLLAYSRVGSQGKPLVPVDASLVVKHVLLDLRAAIAQAGATVEVGAMPTVLADEGQLAQVFQNLIGNAVKFRAEAPLHVSVSASRVTEGWHFQVADNGIGIEPQYAERIFQMFQRLHERGKFEGSGIGLALVKRIVERHGGRIWVESGVDAGSVFHFTMRPAVAKVADSRPRASDDAPFNPGAPA